MGRPSFCICENRDADQFRGNREAGRRLCFSFIDGTNTKFWTSGRLLWMYSRACVGPGRNQGRRFFHDATRLAFITVDVLHLETSTL